MPLQIDLKRMARLRAGGLSFRAALTLGLGLSHVEPSRGSIRYNGAGFKGDREAIGRDFANAAEKAARGSSRNG